jgi:rhamnogalacturonyl hydrolase YesR
MSEKIRNSLIRLTNYCKSEAFKGYDPYDGLNSTLFQAIPFISKNRFARLIWIQLFKRSPLNLRPWVGIKKDYNPKAMGLFLSAYCQLYKAEPKQEYLDRIYFFIEKINSSVSMKYSGACWGYNFDWQAKAFFQPKNTPTVVATTFIGSALLDAYEITGEDQLLKMARSACDFINKDLNRTYDDKGNFAFSYSPLDKTVVFNASLLGSRLLARVYSFIHEKELLDNARKSVAFCCDYQKNDGSWSYGTLDFHQWIDNFHTGYNLECIADYMKYSGDNNFEVHLTKGFDYYIHTFFTEDGVPKYYNNSVYPIDIHSSAQLVITLVKLNKVHEQKVLLNKVLKWTIENMQSDKGYFYYQKNKYFTSKIPYMRWAQAWIFYALSEYLLQDKDLLTSV